MQTRARGKKATHQGWPDMRVALTGQGRSDSAHPQLTCLSSGPSSRCLPTYAGMCDNSRSPSRGTAP